MQIPGRENQTERLEAEFVQAKFFTLQRLHRELNERIDKLNALIVKIETPAKNEWDHKRKPVLRRQFREIHSSALKYRWYLDVQYDVMKLRKDALRSIVIPDMPTTEEPLCN